MKKKILYVITKSEPWGGAQRYVYDLATHLDKGLFEPVVALGGNGVLKQKLDDAGIRTIHIESLQRNINIFKEVLSIFDLIRIIKNESPDVLHGNSSKAGGLGAFVARLMGVSNIIFTVHGWPFKENRNILSKIIIAKLSWLTVFFSHRTIVVSKEDQQRSLWMPFVQNKLTVVYNGIQEAELIEKDSAREKIAKKIDKKISDDALWVGTVSELHPNKGLEYAIRACKKLKEKNTNFVFVIIGSGDKHKKLSSLIKKLGLEENVFLVGFIENAGSLLQAFDIVTLTSLKEGLPYVLLEAGLASRTVVASGVGGIPEIIEDMKSGMLIKPKNAGEIARALLYLHENTDKQKTFGENLYTKIKTKFSMKKMLTITTNLY